MFGPDMSLLSRGVVALERMANALEELAAAAERLVPKEDA